MSVDIKTVERIAHLARLKLQVRPQDMAQELNSILAFVEQLSEVNTDGVEPLTSVVPRSQPMRKDEVTSGGRASDIVANAPETEDNFFLVPKVVE
jgi:aspartyl-tRNA(Asn)/glutamyl-tRNA(Gln) amidotransferase subunit C